jgi:hypothetical protein
MVGNQNLLRLHFFRARFCGNAYSKPKCTMDSSTANVFIKRDDSGWIQYLAFRDTSAGSRNICTNRRNNNYKMDVYVPSCDVRNPPMAENEISDHSLIAARASAELFGRYSNNLFDTDLKACADQVPPHISKGGLRGVQQ